MSDLWVVLGHPSYAFSPATGRRRSTTGVVAGRQLPDYSAEHGVDPARGTETFTAVTLFVDNDRWAGVPFWLRTGKALAADRREVCVVFRPVERLPFGQPDDHARLLVDVFEGDPALSIRGDEAEESWRIVEPIIDAWAAGASPLSAYVAGSEGPSSADERAAVSGRPKT